MVTCGTYRKAHFLNTSEKMDVFQDMFFTFIIEKEWELHAWAIMSNHYHFIASSPPDPETLRPALSKLHTLSARYLNRMDGREGRKVWFQYWDSHITFTNSYLSRLKYVHNNPEHHGIVGRSESYPWCSASWFSKTARPAYKATVESFKTDRLNVKDDFDVRLPVKSGVKPPHSKGISPASRFRAFCI